MLVCLRPGVTTGGGTAFVPLPTPGACSGGTALADRAGSSTGEGAWWSRAETWGQTRVVSPRAKPPPPLAEELEILYPRPRCEYVPELWPAPDDFNEPFERSTGTSTIPEREQHATQLRDTPVVPVQPDCTACVSGRASGRPARRRPHAGTTVPPAGWHPAAGRAKVPPSSPASGRSCPRQCGGAPRGTSAATYVSGRGVRSAASGARILSEAPSSTHAPGAVCRRSAPGLPLSGSGRVSPRVRLAAGVGPGERAGRATATSGSTA